jgi:hypothetical protein
MAVEKIELHGLDTAGWEFVRQHLGDTNVFCAALLKTINSVAGEVFTLAPPSTSADRLSHFDWGGLLPENLTRDNAVTLPDGSTLVPVVSLMNDQARLLRQTVISIGSAVCIVDDYNPRWSDQVRLGPNAFGVGEEVYHLLRGDDDEEAFCEALRYGNVIWHGVAAVCGTAPSLDSARASTAAELERCAAEARLVTCSAYDGEGFVAWRRVAA